MMVEANIALRIASRLRGLRRERHLPGSEHEKQFLSSFRDPPTF